MRLSAIKLSGFKSFVDLTQFQFHGQIVGVVGPNGCGKSNLIDAVRWVLGESKASELRGESMADVIFNGSSGRSASGRASVELIFDNALGRMTGQWSQYAEISVKRVVTRDGVSSYYINNQAVRRRDIQDMFMGTGLGPRAYAIIGQGMVARIVEARPEELRVFLEEAAGISKYKERRRETESRLSDTRENLLRIQDILQELNQQSQKLKTQAAKAERYRAIQADLAKSKRIAALSGLDDSHRQANAAHLLVETHKTELEKQRQALQAQENEVLNLRLSSQAVMDSLNQAQTALFQTNAQITQLEARLRYLKEARQGLMAQHSETVLQGQQLNEQLAKNATEKVLAQEALKKAQTILETQKIEFIDLQNAFKLANEAIAAFARDENAAREQVSLLDKDFAVHSATFNNLNQQAQNNLLYQQKIDKELGQLPEVSNQVLIEQKKVLQDVEIKLQMAHQEIEVLQKNIAQQENDLAVLASEKDRCYSESTRLDARYQSLNELQKKLMSGGQLAQWLNQSGLKTQLAIWQELRVDEGWETALEAVLRERMNARAVKNLTQVLDFAQQNLPTKVGFYSLEGIRNAASSDAQFLHSHVRTAAIELQGIMQHWLSGVRCATNLASAIDARQELEPGQLWVTPEGHLVDQHSVRLYRVDSAEEGLLKRQQEITAIEKSKIAQKIQLDATIDHWNQAVSKLNNERQNLQISQKKYQESVQKQQKLQLENAQESQRQLQNQLQRDSLDAESRRLKMVSAELAEQINASKIASQSVESLRSAALLVVNTQLIRTRKQKETTETARSRLQAAELALQQQVFSLQKIQDQIERVTKTIVEQELQITQIIARQKKFAEDLSELKQNTEDDQLVVLLEQRTQCENKLQQSRNNHESLIEKLRLADELRLSHSLTLSPIQEKLSLAQLDNQAAKMRCAQYQLDLNDLTDDIEQELRAQYPQWPLLEDSIAQIKALEQKTIELGAVNLTAPDELAEVEQRREFLQAQLDDLNNAITTLIKAISEIDSETRGLLHNTFEKVNQHFGVLFPRLFGGGTAKLMMTGNEILDAGVQVMAQPPGKKNSTIHLLSGGEKTLTAITLIFALFQLNPAPFCLLDEVDAPLDDANTERFCRLVAEMSAHTQFVFVTHNKIAMEMAQHLIGVTMQEQGVSRIVSVDLESFVDKTNLAA